MNRRMKKSGSLTRTAAIALAAVCLAIIALLILVPVPDNDGRPGHSTDQGAGAPGQLQSPGVPGAGSAGEDTSQAYRTFPSLESLIAGARQQIGFRVLSPSESVPRGTLVVFRWEDEGGGPWKVTVLDNRGISIREEEVKSPDFTLSSPKPGLYYWTVAREDRVLHVGRVAVR